MIPISNQFRGNSIFWLLRGRLSRWASPNKLLTYIKRCAIKFWYQCQHRGRQEKYGFEWKTDFSPRNSSFTYKTWRYDSNAGSSLESWWGRSLELIQNFKKEKGCYLYCTVYQIDMSQIYPTGHEKAGHYSPQINWKKFISCPEIF